MVKEDALNLAKKYIAALCENGIPVTKAILFGSFARGDYSETSDIDILIVSPEFDKNDESYYGLLWKLTRVADYRIEPIPVGEKRFNTDTGSPVIESAKIEGIELRVA